MSTIGGAMKSAAPPLTGAAMGGNKVESAASAKAQKTEDTAKSIGAGAGAAAGAAIGGPLGAAIGGIVGQALGAAAGNVINTMANKK